MNEKAKSEETKDTAKLQSKKIPVKSIIVFVVLLIVFVVLIQVGQALFSTKDNGSLNVTVGKINVTITEDPEWERSNEDPDPEAEYGIEKYEKNVKGVAAADSEPAYVRVRCIPVIQYYQEGSQPAGQEAIPSKWITAPVSQDSINVISAGSDWVKSGDYWYYKNPISNGQETSELNVKWQILQLDSELATKDHIRTDVRVILEYAQVENDVWKDIFNISEYPQ